MEHLKFIITKHHVHNEDDNSTEYNIDNKNHNNSVELDLPYEKKVKDLMFTKDNGYVEYINKYGYHFTKELSDYICDIKNKNNKDIWTSNQIEKSANNLNLEFKHNATVGDLSYLTNTYFLQFHPDFIQDGVQCIKIANKILNDEDSYDGMVFCRWISDAIGKNIKINWKDFI